MADAVNPTPSEQLADHEHRAIQVPHGKWVVLDGWGYSECHIEFDTKAEAEAWIAGYETGAYNNR